MSDNIWYISNLALGRSGICYWTVYDEKEREVEVAIPWTDDERNHGNHRMVICMNEVRQPDCRTKFCYILIQDFSPKSDEASNCQGITWTFGRDWSRILSCWGWLGRLINVDICSALCRNYMQIEYDIPHFTSNMELHWVTR